MEPPLDIDLNISVYSWDNNEEDINHIPDLNQTPSQVSMDLNIEAPCVEENENEAELEYHDAQPVEVDAGLNSETEHGFEQPNQHVELHYSEAVINSDGKRKSSLFILGINPIV